MTKVLPKRRLFMLGLWIDFQMGMLLKPVSMVNPSVGSCCPATRALTRADTPSSTRQGGFFLAFDCDLFFSTRSSLDQDFFPSSHQEDGNGR